MRTPFRLPIASILVFAASPAIAATFNVTRADDPPPGACLPDDCSLREALQAAAATPEADLILLVAGQYDVSAGALLSYGAVTIRGVGSDLTRIVRGGGAHLLRVAQHGDLTVEGVQLVATGNVVGFDNASALTLREVHVPMSEDNWIGAIGPMAAAVDFRIEDSLIGPGIACGQAAGECAILDSQIGSSITVAAGSTALRMRRSILGPAAGMPTLGLQIAGDGPVSIRDSVIRNVHRPLWMMQSVAGPAQPVQVQRTRFLDNRGPIRSDRDGVIRLQEVEINGHRTLDGAGDPTAMPSALLAQAGPSWSLDKALVVGNRGSNSEGATVLVDSGGRLSVTNSTFDDNTFLPQSSGFGHAIAVYAGAPDTILVMFHNTFRRPRSLPQDTPGTVLTIRGHQALVMGFNNAFMGRCIVAGGASFPSGTGNMTSGNPGCFDQPGNHWVSEGGFDLGSLADHGGFTRSLMPGPDSWLRDYAMLDACGAMPLDQRGHARDPDRGACDIGAIETGAVLDAIFADGFQDD